MPEAVHKLPAGREMDKRVLSIILAYKHGANIDSEDIPYFSTTPEGAEVVKDFLREQERWFTIRYSPRESVDDGSVHVETKGRKQAIISGRYARGADSAHVIANARQEPLAMCRFLVKLHESGMLKVETPEEMVQVE